MNDQESRPAQPSEVQVRAVLKLVTTCENRRNTVCEKRQHVALMFEQKMDLARWVKKKKDHHSQ